MIVRVMVRMRQRVKTREARMKKRVDSMIGNPMRVAMLRVAVNAKKARAMALCDTSN